MMTVVLWCVPLHRKGTIGCFSVDFPVSLKLVNALRSGSTSFPSLQLTPEREEQTLRADLRERKQADLL